QHLDHRFADDFSSCRMPAMRTIMRPDKNPTASALFGVAALLLLIGVLGSFMYSPLFGWLDWIVTLSGVIYLGLAVAARWMRLPAALTAIFLFAVYVGYQAYLNLNCFWRDWIAKFPMAWRFLEGLFFAFGDSARINQDSGSSYRGPERP